MDSLLEHVLPLVMAISRRLAGSGAEDAAQETLLIVFRRLRSLERPETLAAWVATIARREALRQRDESALPLPDDGPAVARPDTVELHDALARLPLPQREVLILRDLVGLSEREAAGLLALTGGTVKSRLHRARAAFRKEWHG